MVAKGLGGINNMKQRIISEGQVGEDGEKWTEVEPESGGCLQRHRALWYWKESEGQKALKETCRCGMMDKGLC